MSKVSKQEYAEFQKHYAWILLKAPDYRLGQAFLNYFPNVSKAMTSAGKLGTLDEFKLYNETDKLKAQQEIDKWLEQ